MCFNSASPAAQCDEWHAVGGCVGCDTIAGVPTQAAAAAATAAAAAAAHLCLLRYQNWFSALQVGSVCVDMGKMKGCEAYNALCKVGRKHCGAHTQSWLCGSLALGSSHAVARCCEEPPRRAPQDPISGYRSAMKCAPCHFMAWTLCLPRHSRHAAAPHPPVCRRLREPRWPAARTPAWPPPCTRERCWAAGAACKAQAWCGAARWCGSSAMLA